MTITLIDSANNPHPSHDAEILFHECQRLGFPTDWWYPLANRIELVGGRESSTAYLLLTREDIEGSPNPGIGPALAAISKTAISHKIHLEDVNGSFDIEGWVFDSYRQILGSTDATDLKGFYLAKFCDIRSLINKSPDYKYVDGAGIFISKSGYNVVSTSRSNSGMAYDASDQDDFPYDLETIDTYNDEPWTWETLLENLWNESVMGFSEQSFPTLTSPPDEFPLDILPGTTSSWNLFIDLLNSIGQELYPLLDGTFRILPINNSFNAASSLIPYVRNLIDTDHPWHTHRRVPEAVGLSFQKRLTAASSTTASDDDNRCHFHTGKHLELFPTTAASNTSAWGALDDLVTNPTYAASGGATATGTYVVGEPGIVGQAVEFPSIAMSALLIDSTTPQNATELESFSEHVLTRYIKACLSPVIDATYNLFLNIAPSPEFGRVVWFLDVNGTCTRFQSIEPSLSPREPYLIGGGASTDRKVAASEDDDVPDALYPKIKDHGTFDADDHQIVYAEVYDPGGDPPKDYKVKLFTALGTGEPGPEGPPGADGPTYTDGCGIIVAGTVISFDAPDVALGGTGSLRVDPNNTGSECFIAVDPAGLYSDGGGLTAASNNASVTPKRSRLKVKPEDLAGDGLTVDPANATVAIGPSRMQLDLGCGLEFDGGTTPAKKVRINRTQLIQTGGGLTAGTGTCDLKVDRNVTIHSVDSISLVLSGGNLTMTVNYTNYSIYGVAGSSSSFTASVATTTCP